ncbi:C69 family dipeptidase [Thermodesulfobacteriota bacterium]
MCDTFVAMKDSTADGSVIFGKNSDREPNEAQALEYHPTMAHRPGETLKCTYIEVPQARRTRAVLLSRPFWMWGAEMGANDKGVVIGNEAVWTKMPLVKEKRLIGMDLLRLGLERGETAAGAMEVIIAMLSDHGQGGPCGYGDGRLFYHNSFLIADPREAWVLETARDLWAAVRVQSFYSISNGLTIGEAFDASHPDLISNARARGWLQKGEVFHFSKCYSEGFYRFFSACGRRRGRSTALLEEGRGRIGTAEAIGVLRDHGGGDYLPDGHLLISRLCAHSANGLTRHAAQSCGSFVSHLAPGRRTHWATGTSAPCTSIFKPIGFDGDVLPEVGPLPGRLYDAGSLWWRHEVLHRSILRDFRAGMEIIEEERNELERQFRDHVDSSSDESLFPVTSEAFNRSRIAEEAWIGRAAGLRNAKGTGWFYRRYWRGQNRRAEIPT